MKTAWIQLLFVLVFGAFAAQAEQHAQSFGEISGTSSSQHYFENLLVSRLSGADLTSELLNYAGSPEERKAIVSFLDLAALPGSGQQLETKIAAMTNLPFDTETAKALIEKMRKEQAGVESATGFGSGKSKGSPTGNSDLVTVTGNERAYNPPIDPNHRKRNEVSGGARELNAESASPSTLSETETTPTMASLGVRSGPASQASSTSEVSRPGTSEIRPLPPEKKFESSPSGTGGPESSSRPANTDLISFMKEVSSPREIAATAERATPHPTQAASAESSSSGLTLYYDAYTGSEEILRSEPIAAAMPSQRPTDSQIAEASEELTEEELLEKEKKKLVPKLKPKTKINSIQKLLTGAGSSKPAPVKVLKPKVLLELSSLGTEL